MRILQLLTTGQTLRSPVEGWDCEDTWLVDLIKEVGLTPSPLSSEYCNYSCVLYALADGYKLLAPPTFEAEYSNGRKTYLWWLTKGY